VSNDDEVERQWREAVRKQQKDEGPPPYSGNYGGSEDKGGCLVLLIAILVSVLGTLANQTTPAEAVPIQPHGPAGFWAMVWHDEFSGDTLNTRLWKVPTDWRINNVTPSKSNVWVYGGHLGMKLSSTDYGGAVLSLNKLRPGMVAEARIRFPGDSVTPIYNFPAWWAAGVKYPDSGEHDIAEGLGKLCLSYWTGARILAYKRCPTGAWNNAYHIYTLERRDRSALVYWDGILVGKYATSDDGGPEHLILNVGWSPKRKVITGDASRIRIDYVRVFTR